MAAANIPLDMIVDGTVTFSGGVIIDTEPLEIGIDADFNGPVTCNDGLAVTTGGNFTCDRPTGLTGGVTIATQPLQVDSDATFTDAAAFAATVTMDGGLTCNKITSAFNHFGNKIIADDDAGVTL